MTMLKRKDSSYKSASGETNFAREVLTEKSKYSLTDKEKVKKRVFQNEV